MRNGVDGPIKIEVDDTNTSVNPTSTAQGGSASQTSVAPLYANASISNFPSTITRATRDRRGGLS